VPYEPVRRKKVALPDRDQPDGYTEPDVPRRYIPTPY
jgi:polyphosphate kinase